MHPIVLSLLETRVLGVLVEKQHTVPDTYPLTLLALTAGCNQKTSRDPVMNASETDVQAALDRLKTLSFVVESSGGRVMRYAHNAERVLAIPSQAVALIAALMLRGPQTVGELRINCDRLHRFADTSAVEGFLHELAARPAGALAIELPRQPGARETRWTHLLSGAPSAEIPAPRHARAPGRGPGLGLRARRAQGERRAARGRRRGSRAGRCESALRNAILPNLEPVGQPHLRGGRHMDIPGMWETARPMLISFGLKALGAIAVFIVGRMLIGFASPPRRRRAQRQKVDATVIRHVDVEILSVNERGHILVVATLGYFGRHYVGRYTSTPTARSARRSAPPDFPPRRRIFMSGIAAN